MKTRIYELARELGVKSDVVVRICEALGIGANVYNTANSATNLTNAEVWQVKLFLATAASASLADTSFLMTEGTAEHFSTYEAAYRKRPVLVPTTVLRELENNLKRKDKGKARLARAGFKLVKRLLRDGLAEIRGEASDVFPGQVINRVVEQHLLRTDLIVLTNDVELMRDLRAKTKRRSVRSLRRLQVIKLHGRTRKAVPFRDYDDMEGAKEEARPKTKRERSRASPRKGPNQKQVQHTAVRRPTPSLEPVDMATGPLRVTEPIKSGSSVRCGSVTAVLGKEIARGGEGAVFELSGNRQYVAKIYQRRLLTVSRRSKLQKMVSMGLKGLDCAWPEALLADTTGTFRGYVMRRAAGVPLTEGLFLQSGVSSLPESWDRRVSVSLAKRLVTVARELHSRGVLIGDISGDNILLDGTKATLVDCDSFQVEQFPCPVHRPEYTAPEVQGNDFSGKLRKCVHEEFALAVLLFQVLMLGKHPYSHVGGGTMLANMKKCVFPYAALRTGDASKIPPGKWRYLFSHLSDGMQDAFTHSFAKGTGTRTSLKEWDGQLGEFEGELDRKELTFVGPKPLSPGYDLSLRPESRRFRSVSEIPRDGLTDFEREMGVSPKSGSRVSRLLGLARRGGRKKQAA